MKNRKILLIVLISIIVVALIVALFIFKKGGEKNVSNNNIEQSNNSQIADDEKKSNNEQQTQGKEKVDFDTVLSAGPFQNGFCIINSKRDQKWGFMDKKGNNVTGFIYDYVSSIDNKSFYNAKKNGKEIIIYASDSKVKEIDAELRLLPEKYRRNPPFYDGFEVIIKDNKCGYINKKGEIVIEPQYSNASTFFNGIAWVKDEKENEFLIDTEGKIVLNLTEKNLKCSSYSDGILAVSDNGKHYYINSKGEKISEEYDKCYNSVEGRAMVIKNKKCGYIDSSTGKLVVDCMYGESSGDFSAGVACVEKDGKYGFIDKEGNVVIDFNYISASQFEYNTNDYSKDGIAMAQVSKTNGTHIYIDLKGNEYSSPIYFGEGMGVLIENKKSTFIDKDGNKVIDKLYDRAVPFSEGLAYVEIDGKTGFIDKTGEFVFELDGKYETVSSFSDGLAYVKSKFGESQFFIDKKGNIVLGNK